MNKLGFIIPVYNHGSTVEAVVQSLLQFSLPIILVDDGNDEKNKALILKCTQKHSEVSLVSYKKNRGKGVAMKAGVLKAQELGLTHVFQLDADGQHDVNACRTFIAESEKNPSALINGYPQYDSSVPSARKSGREFSNIWARIVSLNPSPKDVLCGFRIYPVAPYIKLIKRHAYLNHRMGYDADILVHFLWLGTEIVNRPVNVSYPKDGFSNFRIFRDNFGISVTFARLFVGMIIRLPKLIFLAIKRNASKSQQKVSPTAAM